MTHRGRHRKPSHTGRNFAAVSASGAFALPLTMGTATAAEPTNVLEDIARCESSGNPNASNGSHFGLFQFDLPTWRSVGGSGDPRDASTSEQYRRAGMLLAARGTQPWDASQSCHGHDIAAGSVSAPAARASATREVPSTARKAPSKAQKRATSNAAPAGVTGKRAADGSGRYVCDTSHLSFEACDPGNIGETVSYPLYSGKHRKTSATRVTGAQVANLAQEVPASGKDSLTVAAVRGYLGVPYQWGGEDRDGMDCSGLVYRVLQNLGYSPPRTARAQAAWTTPVSAANARPGDLVYFYSPVTHIGIYLGGGKMIDSSQPGTTVSVHSVYPGASYGRIPT